MFKKIFLIAIVTMAISTISYAQDAVVNKGMTFYICGGSGNINPAVADKVKGTGLLDIHSEMGVTYSQNFANALWLTVSTTAAMCGASPGALFVGDKFEGSAPASFDVTGYGKINTSFGRYFSLGVNTVGRLDFDVKYAIALPGNQRVTLRSYTEVFPTGNSFYATLGNAGSDGDGNPNDPLTSRVLNHMDFRVSYHVQFHPEWAFETDVRFRFNGGSSATAKADSIQALKESFSVRWNNTLYFSDANGFGGYLMFRYQPEKILMGAANVKHRVQFLAGISYAYDLSAL